MANEWKNIALQWEKAGVTLGLNAPASGLEVTGQWAGVARFKVGNIHVPIVQGAHGIKF